MIKTKKESFILYKDFYQAIKHLDDKTLGQLFRSLYEYQVYDVEPEQKSPVYLPFAFYKNQFHVDQKKYDKVVERNRTNGAKGGRPPKETQETQRVKEQPKKAGTDTGTGTVTDTVTDTDTDIKEIVLPFSSEKFSTAWRLWKAYKKDVFKFQYKGPISETTALKKLYDLAQGDENSALLILENSVGNGWKGFFKLDKDQAKGGQVDSEYINELKARLND